MELCMRKSISLLWGQEALCRLTKVRACVFLHKKEMNLRLSPLMIVIGRFEMDM